MSTGDEIAAEVAATMDRSAKALVDSAKGALRDVGKTAKVEIEDSGRKASPRLRVRNMGGAKIGVKARVNDTLLTVSPSGPWGIYEPGAVPHRIVGAGRRVRIGGNWRTGPINHPGTRNTGVWSAGRDSLFRRLSTQIPDQIADEVGEAFSG